MVHIHLEHQFRKTAATESDLLTFFSIFHSFIFFFKFVPVKTSDVRLFKSNRNSLKIPSTVKRRKKTWWEISGEVVVLWGCQSSDWQSTVRLIKKVTTFNIVLHCLNSNNLIIIHEHFKELKKMNNLSPVPSNLIN